MLYVVILMHVRKQLWEGTLSSCYCACFFTYATNSDVILAVGWQVWIHRAYQNSESGEELLTICFLSHLHMARKIKDCWGECRLSCHAYWNDSIQLLSIYGCMDMCMSAESIIKHVSILPPSLLFVGKGEITIFGRSHTTLFELCYNDTHA